jgi:hypothetical protein
VARKSLVMSLCARRYYSAPAVHACSRRCTALTASMRQLSLGLSAAACTQNERFHKTFAEAVDARNGILQPNIVTYIALLNIHLQSQLRVFIDVFFSLTTCFGPFRPSSGESQYIIFSHTSPENYRYLWRCVTKYNILWFTWGWPERAETCCEWKEYVNKNSQLRFQVYV